MNIWSKQTYILDVALDGDALTIRLDADPLAEGEDTLTILTLVLHGCPEPAPLVARLQQSLDQPFSYDWFDQDGMTTAVLWINERDDDEIELLCAAVQEVSGPPTTEDWQRRCRRLARAYHNEEAQHFSQEQQLAPGRAGAGDRPQPARPGFLHPAVSR